MTSLDLATEVPATELLDVRLFIDGEYSEGSSGRTFESRNPATGEPVARVALADKEDVDRAVGAARGAFETGPWRRMGVAERAATLARIGEGIRRRVAQLAALETRDTGKPIAESLALDIPRSAANFEYFAELAKHAGSEATPVDGKFLNYTLREPAGVAGCIGPWNLPLLLLTWKIAPALVCGNSVVAKPSELTPMTAGVLGEIANEAGLPPGVLNVVHGFGPDAAGAAIAEHPGVDLLSFTGESATGKAIMRAASSNLKNVSFELGGKAAGIVFADADLDLAVAQCIRAAMLNQGELCLATPRLLVERTAFADFCERFRNAATQLRFGDPLDPATSIGALIDREHYERVVGYVRGATEEGARLFFGGARPELPVRFSGGHFLEPTAFVDVRNDMRICTEEVFGPVVTIAPFDDEAEAVRIANDTSYGLAATIFTRDLSRAHRTAARLRAGLVWVNCWFVRELSTPFGGMKESGIGREGGMRSLEFYSELKNVCVAIAG